MSFLLRAGDAVHWVPEMSRSVRPWNDARAMWRLYRLMRAERPLVVHTHTAKAGTLGRIAARLAGVPVVIHTFHGNSLRGYFSPWANCVARGIERMLARVTDCICVIAEQQADEVSGELRIAPRDKFRIVPLGLDLSPFLELPEPRFDSAPFTVAWLGRFVPVKGVPLLAAVIDETLRRTDRIRFLIAGDGEQREVVRDIASRYGAGRVEWLGWQRDVAPVIARAHLLLQTSPNEGTPVARIPGMAAAR